MPFEPKLVKPDDGPLNEGPSDDEAEFDVPREFELFAVQLRADAQMLAERYPSDWSESGDAVAYLARIQQSTRAGLHRKTVWWSIVAAAAVLLLAVGGGALYFLPSNEDVQGQVAGSPAQGDVAEATRPDDSADRSAAREEETARPAVSLEKAETLLIHVTGPELEGLLDLMETQNTDEPLLSI